MKTKMGMFGYRIIKTLVWLFYPRMEVVGEENLPEGPAILVGNHAQMHGPIAAELYLPGQHYTWCAGEMMHRKEVADYAYQDFWSEKPPTIRWFYRLLSYLIIPLAVCVFNHANTIGVYHDSRIISTFRTTVQKLQDGSRVVIFPEHGEPCNRILYQFQTRFIDVAKTYAKKTGESLPFVPMYVAPKRKQLVLGTPVYFDPDAPIERERERITAAMMEQITQIACGLPRHKVVPYRNMAKRFYPFNLPEEAAYEKTSR